MVAQSSSAVAGFLPSTSAFRFVNHWPHQPVVRIPFPLAPRIAPDDHYSSLSRTETLPSARTIRGDPSCRRHEAASALLPSDRFAIRRVPTAGRIFRSVGGRLGGIAIGDASKGLCGGMIYAVRDLFEAHLPPPERAEPPPIGSPLYSFVVDRLIDSFDVPRGVARYYQLMRRPDADSDGWFGSRPGAARATVVEEWPRVRLDLDQGILSPLGVVTLASADPRQLGVNHQVLAYAYATQGSQVTLRVYDPNTPTAKADAVTLSFDTARPGETAAFRHTIAIGGRPVRAFFRSTYRWSDPRRATEGNP